jgi:hypothetical protein
MVGMDHSYNNLHPLNNKKYKTQIINPHVFILLLRIKEMSSLLPLQIGAI